MQFKRGPLFYWLVGVSWVHLCTISIWSRIWRAGSPMAYYLGVTDHSVWAALLLVFGGGSLIAAAAWKLRRRVSAHPALLKTFRILFMLSLILPANQLRRDVFLVAASSLAISPTNPVLMLSVF